MKIHIDFMGLPELKEILSKDREFEFEGGTVADFMNSLVEKHGDKIERMLFGGQADLKPGIQIFLNKKTLVPGKKIDKTILQEGDRILFMLLIGGG